MEDLIKHKRIDTIGRQLLLVSLCLVLITHGVILYFTLPKTYDAFVHMFFADHYARFWFEPNEYRWYTGFMTTSYPPLVHQCIALLSKVFPLKISFCIYAIAVYELLVIGIYRFSKLFFNKSIAGVAALLAVLSSALIETVHVYGQVPTITGMALLLNALPFLYQFLVKRKWFYLVMALSFIAVVVCSHHVTAIFGMVFFIAPTIFMALADSLEVKPKNFFLYVKAIVLRALKKWKSILLFGFSTINLTLMLLFPYWQWSKNDPIAQVSIPHGSRDSFFLHPSSGLIFYIIPLALIIALIFAVSYSITKERRNIGWAVSFFLCLLLGSGGTTPIPKLMLGENAFNILTLDRFGFWAAIIAIPFMAKFIYSFLDGSVKAFWVKKIGARYHFSLAGISGFAYLVFILFIFHLGSFRPLQPNPIEIKPILNFLNRDDHIRWRFLTLGFGDQMAWLSTNSLAASVDGNYHSARRLPELTSRAVERLENAKFAGEQGLASLNDFLAKAEKYNLKYVFSNDRFYDPILYYSGWSRTIRLENGIMVWEKGNISTIKPVQPKKMAPILKKLWGILPVTILALCLLLSIYYLRYFKDEEYFDKVINHDDVYPKWVKYSSSLMPLLFFSFFISKQIVEILLKNEQATIKETVENYYNHLDFQEFETAFHFFKPDPTYTLDQYLLEKSVKDGGLVPSFSKLDSLSIRELKTTKDESDVEVKIRWNTALGKRNKIDTLHLVKENSDWYIIPPVFKAEIPEEQMMSYNVTLFKKMGKRVISSFPTVKDDRVKKPFAAFKQMNCVRDETETYLCGEILNADNIPVNFALQAKVTFESGETEIFYPRLDFQYNLSPKSSSYFKIPLLSNAAIDTMKIKNIVVYTETDVSERGYIHGGITTYAVNSSGKNVTINTSMFNELSTDISMPAVLIAEKDKVGRVLNTQLFVHDRAVRSGMNISFKHAYEKKNIEILNIPVQVFINGGEREVLPLEQDATAQSNEGLVLVPHCFMAQEIYIQ